MYTVQFHEIKSGYLHLPTYRLEFIVKKNNGGDFSPRDLCTSMNGGGVKWAMTSVIETEGAVLPGKPVEALLSARRRMFVALREERLRGRKGRYPGSRYDCIRGRNRRGWNQPILTSARNGWVFLINFFVSCF